MSATEEQDKRLKSIDDSLGCLTFIALGILLTMMEMCGRMS